ncbi:ABC transporter ATP-binding protein [Microbaculum marinum]|uniref:ABC transporter ATP-binding protein n=1 Tax=Microbaculum marinum TaxID=1764581 RepID=A0AAW9RU14_9HYPH
MRGLTKRYGDVTAVEAIDFDIVGGSTTGLLGGNGAGKTTTIAMLMGLVLPTGGSISVMDVDMLRHRHRVLHRINFESPYVDMPMRLTVSQNLTVFGRLYGLDRLRDRIAEIASALDLTHLLDRPCGRLSAGQKTRVSLAKALINQPELLLLDEPTASLDPDTADWVRSHLEAYRAERGATILLASHNMPEVERLCDRVMMMKEGRIVDDGAPGELISRYGRDTLEDVFLDVARGTGRAEAGGAEVGRAEAGRGAIAERGGRALQDSD